MPPRLKAPLSSIPKKHMVLIYGIKITNTYFPSLDPALTTQMDLLVRSFLPPSVNISLDRILAYVPKSQSVKIVDLKNDPPFIFVSYSPGDSARAGWRARAFGNRPH